MTSPPLTCREYAYLRITGPGTHEEVTSIVGINPTEAWNVGDINPRNGKPRSFMSWHLSSGVDDRVALDSHLVVLFQRLRPKSEALRKLWVDFDIMLQCVGYFPATGHGQSFSREQIRQAAQLGLSLDLDFYYVEDHGHEV